MLPLVYGELRKLAAAKMALEKPGQTLQATTLVHEAWLRLVGSEEQKAWNGRGHFFGAAAEAMRRKARLRHGGQMEMVQADEIEIAAALPEARLVQVSEALDELEREAPEAAQVVKLRYRAIQLTLVACKLPQPVGCLRANWLPAVASQESSA